MSARLRPARPRDAAALGGILWQGAAAPYSRAECIAFCRVMIARGWVRVARRRGRIQGFIARDGDEVCALYLARRARGRGIGKLLVDEAKAVRPRLWLRCAQANGAAQRFYRREGFVEAGRSDGRARAEQQPDITYIWAGEGA
ncbi:GNAT family N-acetyltransferase [Pseudooceanicola sp.]|uniref:GNAT family N-acetyltransferase n=1 Tax=Pseudooceanicola sp. TaxID=1914328 RepID=UPI0035127799